MGRLRNGLRFLGRWLPWIATGAAATFRKLPEQSQTEIREVAKEPGKWGQSIEKAWDTSRIGADNFKETAGILANLLLGRRIDKEERKLARENLAAMSLIVPPLRVFMIPGSHVLLGIMARATPWRLIPDDWIPIDALRTVRRIEKEADLERESSVVRRLLRLKH
ncbi:MAG: hypothetical protein QGF28_00565 [Candidatus Thalassarchaeaceae archaeon]|jgi:hypothetical protein|nr:hypothetical protein [Euryarchaeota archaeon]MDP6220037.1 hypothetical protein [Candidatus Thalassarchaeaceae archaeon]MBV43750.1 hypothetical protein [Euryarchaeota archaeon]MDP7091195.1 hypothetical protein [Candidatus Thalassarchaeaceae archaeon]MDP7257118.1 hypothetical protein [Candidatus Thalassarchaeaceae archaeon]|tara:strand:- start:9960 stop:10454 length:495 start_codon:yes stop_codon:yes gene_type:complete